MCYSPPTSWPSQNLSHSDVPSVHQGQAISIGLATIFMGTPSWHIIQFFIPLFQEDKDPLLEGVVIFDWGGENMPQDKEG